MYILGTSDSEAVLAAGEGGCDDMLGRAGLGKVGNNVAVIRLRGEGD